MLYAPKSEKARGPPIIGIESLLEGKPKSFPLLLRLSRARLTSIRMSVKLQSRLQSQCMLLRLGGGLSTPATEREMQWLEDTPSI